MQISMQSATRLRAISTRAESPWLVAVLVLVLGVACAKPAPPDWRILRAPPVMTERVEAEAAARSAVAECIGAPANCVPTRDESADFMWACDAYGAYIDDLRSAHSESR